MIDILNGPTGFCGNHQGSGHTRPTESITDTINPPINPGPPTNLCGNHQGSNFQAHYDPTESIADALDNKPINPDPPPPIGSCGNHQGSNVQIGNTRPTESLPDATDNNPTINFDALVKPAEENKAVTDLYMSDGDDYTIDDTALSNAQMKTGDDKKADSVVGSGGGGSETNSNINAGVFGGSARAAHPGYSLW